jgi:3-deoxy-D-manno-octulosonate 8-phosphate phosphatase (KDO 8-P phosphatase)
VAGKVARGGARRPTILQRAKKIRLLILDVDGVLTDGSIILDNEGNEYKSFHVRDGHGIKMLLRAGVRVALVTGRESKIVARRARELGITDVFQKCFDKAVAYTALVEKYGLSGTEIAYVGDDIVDAPIMRKVGLPISVADSAEEIKEYALMVTGKRGGRGAVREVADVILKSKGLWQEMFDEYFET